LSPKQDKSNSKKNIKSKGNWLVKESVL
jgi:hypothetical protein